MLESILPASAAVVDTRGEIDVELFAEEEAALGQAVEKRRREFITARACARAALAQLDMPDRAVPRGSRGEPVWPLGIVGSITHCPGYRACAVARAADLLTIGVDAEVDEPLPERLIGDIALPEERERIAQLRREEPSISWDRLLFSIKESVYKAWFPLTKAWLGFEDASVRIDPAGGTFEARLLVPGPTLDDRALDRFSGRWLAAEGLLFAAIAEPRDSAGFPVFAF